MKNSIFILIALFGICISTNKVNAQATDMRIYTIQSVDTSKNADTVVAQINSAKSNVASFTTTVKKVSGQGGGYILLQGGNIPGVWDNINTDTLFITSKPLDHKTWIMESTLYQNYRAYYVSTGTQKSVLSFTYLYRLPMKKED